MANYLIRNPGGMVQGPFSVSEIQQLIKLGRVTATTEIQQEGGQTWRRAAEIKGIAAALGVPMQPRQNGANCSSPHFQESARPSVRCSCSSSFRC